MRIKLYNIGNFETHEAEFNKGVNILQMQNAAGKSVLLKSLATVFSIPIESRVAEECAENLGIWRRDPPQPLVRVGTKQGTIEVDFNGKTKACEIEASGEARYSEEGDERFLFTSYLSPSSPLFRKISTGEDNLKWILPAVSKVEYYERAYNVISSFLDEFKSGLEEANNKNKHLEELKSKLKNSETELESINKEIENVSSEIEKAEKEVDPKIKEEYNKISSELEELRNKRRQIENRLGEASKELNNKQETVEKLNTYIEELDKKMQETGEKLEKLRTYDDINKGREEIEKTLDGLKVEKAGLDKEQDLFNSAKMLEERDKCPLCGSGSVDKNHIEKKVSEINEKIKNTESRIRILNSEKDRLTKEHSRRKELETRLKSINDERQAKETELEESSSTLKPTELEIESLKSELNDYKDEIKEKEERLEYTESKIKESSEVGALYEKLGELKAKKDELLNTTSNISTGIKNNSTVYIIGFEMDVEKAIQFCEDYIQTFESVLQWVEDKIREQRKGFAEKFNESIRGIIKELDFEFSTRIDPEELKIVIERDGLKQSIESLSTTERSVIAVILQLALKEAFLPDNPLFIIDEIIMDFDQERANKLVEYLLRASEERGWLVILAKVGENKEIRQISSSEEVVV